MKSRHWNITIAAIAALLALNAPAAEESANQDQGQPIEDYGKLAPELDESVSREGVRGKVQDTEQAYREKLSPSQLDQPKAPSPVVTEAAGQKAPEPEAEPSAAPERERSDERRARNHRLETRPAS